MRLATSPRPDPPPVPPRPSGRIVAEALEKSSPKLARPTRQAPPPPNKKPWRSTDSIGNPTNVVEKTGNAKRGSGPDTNGSAKLIAEGLPSSINEGSIDERKSISSKTRFSTIAPVTKIASRSVANDEATRGRAEKEDSFVNSDRDKARTLSENDRGATTATTATVVVVVDRPKLEITRNDKCEDDNIRRRDWLEAGVRYSSTKITLPGDGTIDRIERSTSRLDDDRCNDAENDIGVRDREDEADESEQRARVCHDFNSIRERIAMSSLQGLPPLPRSLSGFNLNEGRREIAREPPPPPPTRSSSKTSKNMKSTQPSGSRPSPPGRRLTTLDTQLAILRKEMFGLRRLDLSLLSQLWSLNESIQEFRQLLQEQEDRAPSPSPSSEEGDDASYGSDHPPPPPRRPAPSLRRHGPPRPPRPPRHSRPSASDESLSGEEYGAV